jgi:hypothetical protein
VLELESMHHTAVARVRLLAHLALLALTIPGCTMDAPATEGWTGNVHDSAGVVLVENPASGLWTTSTAWRLEEDLRVGVAHGDPSREFGSISDVGVAASGHIFVLERQAGEVRVFTPGGEFVRTIGRGGSGPGELASPSAVLIGAGDTIFVPDSRNQRVQRFVTDGSDAGSFPILAVGGISLDWRMSPPDALVQEVRTLPASGADGERVLLLARAADGAVRDTLAAMPVGEAMVIRDGQPHMRMFGAEPFWTTLTDGRAATARNDEYRIEIRTADGGLDHVVSKPFERRPFTQADRRELRALIQQSLQDQPPSPATDRMLQSMSYADHYPVFAALFGGPHGTLWVRHAKDATSLELEDMAGLNVRAFGAPDYDVFDRDGRFLGTITLPDRFEPMRAHGDHVYGVQRDELGVQYVVRLRVVR